MDDQLEVKEEYFELPVPVKEEVFPFNITEFPELQPEVSEAFSAKNSDEVWDRQNVQVDYVQQVKEEDNHNAGTSDILRGALLQSGSNIKVDSEFSAAVKSEMEDTVLVEDGHDVLEASSSKDHQCFTCEQCRKSFNTGIEFEHHSLVHKLISEFVCAVCCLNFENLIELNSHTFQIHHNTAHICNICHKMYEDSKDFKLHLQMESQDFHYHCDVCNTLYENIFQLNIHRFEHTVKHPFQYDREETFTHSDQLKQHQIDDTSERPFSCEECNKCFRTLKSLKRHKYTHKDQFPYQCEKCSRPFKVLHNLKEHLLTHSDTHSFHCGECKKSFKTSKDLNAHNQYIHFEHQPYERDTSERPFSCEECKKCFKTLSHLKRHQYIHKDDFPYQCEKCARSFKLSHHLKEHLVTHSDERSFHCCKCEKSFKAANHLNAHYHRVHLLLRPYECDKCNKTFKTMRDIEIHQDTGTDCLGPGNRAKAGDPTSNPAQVKILERTEVSA